VSYGENQDEVFLGMRCHVAERSGGDCEIDSEIRRLVRKGYIEATKDPRREACRY